jgi:ATP-dependent Lon protease
MAKPKNQTELVKQFMTGATAGMAGSLSIHQDTLYNTEGEEFLAVARRLGPAGNCNIFVVNAYETVKYHGMYMYHKQLVLDAIHEQCRSSETSTVFMPLEVYAQPFDRHPLNSNDAKLVIKACKETADANEVKMKQLFNHTYERASYEQEYSDEELMEAFKQTLQANQDKLRYLREDIQQAEFDRQIRDIEELVRIPQIMEQAIKEGGIDPDQLKSLLATRDRVQQTLDDIEKHISVILSIPGVSGAL